MDSKDLIDLEDARAHNYHPLPVVVATAEGSWVTDVEGKRYLDFLSAYSALNFGHRHPRLIAAAERQLGRVTLTSRAVLPISWGLLRGTGWAGRVGSRPADELRRGGCGVRHQDGPRLGLPHQRRARRRGEDLVAHGNFHGRTTTIISFSDDPVARKRISARTRPGFEAVDYGDLASPRSALADPNVVAFLVEPIQGEGGVLIPPEWLPGGRCRGRRDADVLFMADEIQSGLGRTGKTPHAIGRASPRTCCCWARPWVAASFPSPPW